MRIFAIVAGVVLLGVVIGSVSGVAEESKPLDLTSAPTGDKTSLMGILSEWAYPGATWLDGAKMGDGGNPELPSIKCQTVLITPDSFEDVTKFYAEKLNVAAKDDQQKEKKPAAGQGGGQTVTVIDDSVMDEGVARTVKLQVITVNRLDSSTTLVISRADEERDTHIVWSHFQRVGGGK